MSKYLLCYGFITGKELPKKDFGIAEDVLLVKLNHKLYTF